jgi:hypothetical protein
MRILLKSLYNLDPKHVHVVVHNRTTQTLKRDDGVIHSESISFGECGNIDYATAVMEEDTPQGSHGVARLTSVRWKG